MTTFTQALAGEFRAELARQGKPTTVLASAWGVTPESARAKLAGRSKITDQQLDAGASALGFDTFDFIGRARANAIEKAA